MNFRRARVIMLVGVAVACSFCFVGCPGDAFQVIFPTNSQDFAIGGSDQLVMTVRFDSDVDMSSLVAGTNVILNTDTVMNANITITAGATANEIVITSDDTISNLLTFDPDGLFSLTLKGSGANPILSVDGIPLDGDLNGFSGGDFVIQYILLG